MSRNITGIILYNRELNNCLNGVYTNNLAGGAMFNEIAIKKSEGNSLDGIYHSAYFETNVHEATRALLTIKKEDKKKEIYTFEWEINGEIWFKGTGYIMNEKQVAVHYWGV